MLQCTIKLATSELYLTRPDTILGQLTFESLKTEGEGQVWYFDDLMNGYCNIRFEETQFIQPQNDNIFLEEGYFEWLVIESEGYIELENPLTHMIFGMLPDPDNKLAIQSMPPPTRSKMVIAPFIRDDDEV